MSQKHFGGAVAACQRSKEKPPPVTRQGLILDPRMPETQAVLNLNDQVDNRTPASRATSKSPPQRGNIGASGIQICRIKNAHLFEHGRKLISSIFS